MSFNRNDANQQTHLILRNAGLASLLALGLAACASNDAMMEPVTSAPPPPPPPAPVAAPAPPPPVYRVRTGSPSVLTKFPRGSEVTRETRICLKDGEQITISGSNGQSVSYRGPGCMQRTAPPTGTNQGGFTFGWNGWSVAPDVQVLP